MVKQSKSAKVRALLAEGISPKDIAKKLRIKSSYVHTIKWQWQHKKGNGKVVVTQSVPVEVTPPLALSFKDRLDLMIASRVDAYLEKVLS